MYPCTLYSINYNYYLFNENSKTQHNCNKYILKTEIRGSINIDCNILKNQIERNRCKFNIKSINRDMCYLLSTDMFSKILINLFVEKNKLILRFIVSENHLANSVYLFNEKYRRTNILYMQSLKKYVFINHYNINKNLEDLNREYDSNYSLTSLKIFAMPILYTSKMFFIEYKNISIFYYFTSKKVCNILFYINPVLRSTYDIRYYIAFLFNQFNTECNRLNLKKILHFILDIYSKTGYIENNFYKNIHCGSKYIVSLDSAQFYIKSLKIVIYDNQISKDFPLEIISIKKNCRYNQEVLSESMLKIAQYYRNQCFGGIILYNQLAILKYRKKIIILVYIKINNLVNIKHIKIFGKNKYSINIARKIVKIHGCQKTTYQNLSDIQEILQKTNLFLNVEYFTYIKLKKPYIAYVLFDDMSSSNDLKASYKSSEFSVALTLKKRSKFFYNCDVQSFTSFSKLHKSIKFNAFKHIFIDSNIPIKSSFQFINESFQSVNKRNKLTLILKLNVNFNQIYYINLKKNLICSAELGFKIIRKTHFLGEIEKIIAKKNKNRYHQVIFLNIILKNNKNVIFRDFSKCAISIQFYNIPLVAKVLRSFCENIIYKKVVDNSTSRKKNGFIVKVKLSKHLNVQKYLRDSVINYNFIYQDLYKRSDNDVFKISKNNIINHSKLYTTMLEVTFLTLNNTNHYISLKNKNVLISARKSSRNEVTIVVSEYVIKFGVCIKMRFIDLDINLSIPLIREKAYTSPSFSAIIRISK